MQRRLIHPERIGEITIASHREPGTSALETSTPRIPIRTLHIPPFLQSCPLFQQILHTPCFVSLTDRRYHLIESNRTIQLSSARSGVSTLQYSLLTSILTQLAKQNPKQVCITGSIRLRLQGTFHAPDQRVVTRFSKILFGFTSREQVRNCAAHRLIYIPVTMDWAQDTTGHAAALMIDNEAKTIQLYDPNGTNAPYFAASEQWLRHQFQARRLFPSYTFIQSASIPHFGYQAGTELQMCAYFSALYIAMRVACPHRNSQDVNDSLERIPKREIRHVLSLFHCFLIELGQQSGVLRAASTISDLHQRVFHIFINTRNREEKDNLKRVLERVEHLVQTDIVQAVDLLTSTLENTRS